MKNKMSLEGRMHTQSSGVSMGKHHPWTSGKGDIKVSAQVLSGVPDLFQAFRGYFKVGQGVLQRSGAPKKWCLGQKVGRPGSGTVSN